MDPPLENDPDRVTLDEPLMLDAPLARRVERGDPDAKLFMLQLTAQSSPDARLVVTLPADAPIAQGRIRERRTVDHC